MIIFLVTSNFIETYVHLRLDLDVFLAAHPRLRVCIGGGLAFVRWSDC